MRVKAHTHHDVCFRQYESRMDNIGRIKTISMNDKVRGIVPDNTDQIKDGVGNLTDKLFQERGLPTTLAFYDQVLKVERDSSRFGYTTTLKAVTDSVNFYTKEVSASIPEEHTKTKSVVDVLQEAATLGMTANVPLTMYRTCGPLMGIPVFTSARSPQIESYTFSYQDKQKNNKYLKVTPSVIYGQPTHRDGDILRYALSKLGEIYRLYGVLVSKIRVTRYELLHKLGKGGGKADYIWLDTALNRLTTTHYRTNVIHTEKEEFSGSFFNYKYITNEDHTLEVEISFTPTFCDSLIPYNRSFLAINEEIITEPSNFRKFLLELGLRHLGTNTDWSISLDNLYERSRYVMSKKEFKRQLTSRVSLPYSLEIKKGKEGQIVTFYKA